VKLNTIELTLEVGTEQFMNPELFIAGGGPAGLATAIVAARSGLSVVVSDTGHSPIDKAYGEGLLPDSLEALSHLGVDLSFVRSFPVHGVRFVGTGSNPQASFPHGVGFGIRCTVLHSLLLRHAEAAGVRFLWNTTFGGIQANSVAAVKHDRNPQPVGHIFRERNRECTARAPITDLKPFMQSKASTTKVFCLIGQKPTPWLH
jgi:flavin-dependent dehydrogenase